MHIARGLDDLVPAKSPVLVTLGNFDGVHLGHQKIIKELVERSKSQKGCAVLVTFDPHPRQVLDPKTDLKLITSMHHRLRILEKLGVDVVVIFEFNQAFSNLKAEFFIREVLFHRLKYLELIVGRNYAFGKNREGNTELLDKLSKELNFTIDFVDPIQFEGRFVSSTWVRALIKEGSFSKASELLGRPFSVIGRVVHGRGRGATVGFRTANLDLKGILLPPKGVYAVEIILNDRHYFGLANIGVRPTFGLDEIEQLEAHILDFDQDIYGSHLEIVFKYKIRDEMRFDHPDHLRAQIEADVEDVRLKFLTA